MELHCFTALSEIIQQIFSSPLFVLHPFFILLFLLMMVFMLFMLFVPIISILLHIYRKWEKEKEELIKEQYKIKVFEYLMKDVDTVPVFEGLERDSNKDILINIFFDLTNYVDGDDKKRLRYLFNKQNMNVYIFKKIQSSLCYKTAYYLERLSIISSEAIPRDFLEKLLVSPSMEIRMYAMQALIVTNPDRIETLFSDYKYDISLWEQMNYYLFFIYREIKIPDFHRLALSQNRGVSLFAIRMVRMFNQRLGSIEGYESLLKHPDLEIQFEMFRTLTEFGYTNINILMNDILPKVSPLLRMQIMTYLSKTPLASTSLMMHYYEEDNSSEFRLHVLYCIYNFIKNGKEDIDK